MTGRSGTRYAWVAWPTRDLLGLRISDLGLSIEGSRLERPILRVLTELEARDLRVRPHFWLSDEWFSPDGIPGVAIPFWLAHPRLMQLERSRMLEVEGGASDECMRILRHEVGHAVQHAFALQRRKDWRAHFGSSTVPYPEWYRPNPASKRYVQHLRAWYAQAHPVEDFAETFAVWLAPRSRWRERYDRWPALKKLEYVDELMGELAGRRPKIRRRARPDEVRKIHKTLRQHYEEKQERYAVGYSATYDDDLRRLFSERGGRESAARFLVRHRREIRELVSRWTGELRFTLDHVLEEIIGRCRELGLRVRGSERRLELDFAILLTAYTVHYLYRGRHWRPL